MEYFAEFGYFGLFVSAFFAATILPLGSEVVLVALLLNGLSVSTLIIVATIGNVLGSVVNYCAGYWASFELIQKLLGISEQEYSKAQKRFRKYGLWSLCLAWVPIIGDPLTLVAGVLRIRFVWFLALVSVGKLVRYVIISYIVL